MAFPIIQFGTSRFLQAHVDLFVSEALGKGAAMGRIVAVQTTQSAESRKRIAAFAEGRPYVVQIKGIVGDAVIDNEVEVSSVGDGVDANEHWAKVERLFNEARCMVSNTADRGYETYASDAPDGETPRSFPAKLAKLLLARHRAGAPPITLFPCELTPDNGKTLRAVVLKVLDGGAFRRRRGAGSARTAYGSIRSSTASSQSRSSRSARWRSLTLCGRSRTSPGSRCHAATPTSW